MTEQYTQTVEVRTQNSDKAKLIVGILCMMLSLVFLIVAILKNHLFFIGFGVFVVIGFLLVQLFESAPCEFIYSVSPKNLVISKKNNAHNTKRKACISLENIERIELFCRRCRPRLLRKFIGKIGVCGRIFRVRHGF